MGESNMPARVRILCGPAGSGKTRRLLPRYREVAGAAFGAALWLAPTRRSVEAIRPQLLAGRSACLAPNLITFQDFAEEIIRVNDPAARPLSHVQRRLLAEEIVAELHGRGQLSHFRGVVETRGFAETVFELLAELKQNEIWPERFAEVVARKGKQAPAKEQQCALIYNEYQKALIAHQLYDLEGRFWYARDLLGRGARRPFEAVRAVFVDGFTDFTRTQFEILEALAGWAEELWITLPDEADTTRAELFTRPRATLTRLGALPFEVERLEPAADGGPAGLAHLERQLFRPYRALSPAGDAAGVSLLQAPGTVGETRLVARRIKALLLEGTRADDIVVTVRDLLPYADLIREVFADYGIPVDVEGAEPLLRNPAVATLLRTLRVPEDEWAFGPVTALLRSGYFCPEWPETRFCPEVAHHAEALLRLLGEPRGREAYLRAVRRWEEKVQPGLEDEQAEESRRQKIHDLAKRCRPFLERFFQAWDGAPVQATLEEHGAWLRHLAEDLGISRAASRDPRDAAALGRLWQELEQWGALQRRLHPRRRLLNRAQFARVLGSLAAEAGLARTPRGPGRVRVLSAELARHLRVPYVFLMGLGERGFPRLAAPGPLFDEQERLAFKQAGLDFGCVADLLPDEMLLFYQVVTRAGRALVLSYPAVDDKGQALLPSSFLSHLLDCFAPGAVPVERRNMLIEGYDRDTPLSAAEYRIQVAACGGELQARRVSEGNGHPSLTLRVSVSPLAPDVRANLADAAELSRLRFHLPDHTPYDGLFRDPAVIAEVQKRFGSEKVFSPTALESYVLCPFRFFLGNVLHLEPLEEPREEIESTDRGLAFHRALSRLHTYLKDRGIHLPEEAVDAELMGRLDEAVEEAARRAPSPAAERLWRIEGQRLKRAAERYRPHWKKFIEPWLPRGVRPQPFYFEVSFGLPVADGETPHDPLVIRVDGVEVRVSGRIDRVDVAELPEGSGASHGFWIIDYKTGNPAHYTGSALREFRRLQLTLYALAVQEVLLAGKESRPLGLAYWLVADSGPKTALPAWPKKPVAWFDEADAWGNVREQLRRWVVRLVSNIRQGTFPLKPRSDDCTQTCDFGQVCRISQCREIVEGKTWQLPLPVVP
jgi:ATP-dependent helicase/DNAse subunit B